jgi:methyltransferase-like protein
MEQYLDFLRNRKFRQTLLVHQKTDLKRGIEPTRVHNLFVSSPMVPVDTDDGRPNEDMQTFSHPNGKSVTVTSPIQKSALKQLAEIWPSELSVELLANNTWQGLLANQRPNREECLFEVAAMILECFSSQLVELFASKSNAVSYVGNLPQASAYNRYLLDHGELVTNARHETVKLSNFDRAILQQLDGKVTVAELTEEMQRWSVKTEVSQPDTSKPQEISQAVEHSLVQMAKSALLIS